MKRSTWAIAAGAVVLLGLGGLAISRRGTSSDTRATERIDANLVLAAQLDTELTAHVMANRSGILSDYDPIVATTLRLQRTLRQLEADGKIAYSNGEYARAAEAYKSALEAKLENVERFKTENALLRNSLAYLPTVVASIERKSAVAQRLMRQVLVLQSHIDSGEEAALAESIRILEQAASSADEEWRGPLEDTAKHAAVVLREHRATVETLKAISEAPTPAAHDRLASVHRSAQAAAAAAAAKGRALALTACAILALAVVAIMLRLRAASARIREANATLEARVEARTQDLLKAKEANEAVVASLESLLAQVTQTADRVATTSMRLRESADAATDAADSISTSLLDVAGASRGTAEVAESMVANSANQINAIRTSHEALTEVNRSLEAVRAAGLHVANGAAEAQTSAEEGARAVRSAVESIGEVRSQVQVTRERVRELGEQSVQIGRIADTIRQIAGQTNLLSLNAAIEAARAGEHGRGFAVVADEVRKLAAMSSNATNDITAIIGRIRAEVSEVVSAVEQADEMASTSATEGEAAGKTLDRILDAVQGVASQSDALGNATGGMTRAFEVLAAQAEIVREASERSEGAMLTVSAAAQEVAASTQEATEMAQRGAASAIEVRKIAHELEAMASTLEAAVHGQQESHENLALAA